MREVRSLVLVVEDQPDLRSVLLECLSAEFAVAGAGSAAAGLAAARDLKPDLILCDYNMPGGDGLTLVRALRADTRFSGITVAMMSGQCAPNEAVALNLPFLSKPFDAHGLVHFVYGLLQCAPAVAA